MYQLAHLVVSAERDLRNNTMYARDEGRSEPLAAQLWRHKRLLLAAAGALALLIVGGSGV